MEKKSNFAFLINRFSGGLSRLLFYLKRQQTLLSKNKWLQGVTGGYKGLQKVTGGYKG